MTATRHLPYWITAAVVLVTFGGLLAMGRDLICPCGHIDLWHDGQPANESSQHLMDWYTPSHLLHGFLFYAALWLVANRIPFGWKLAISVAVECVWEVIENSAWVIDRYRAVTISLDYNGDSVINSTVDILAMIVGFYLARAIPVWASVAIVIGFEVLTAYLIRDGLALNVLMLLYPLEAVLQWQGGG
jgi:hypothetical protein